MAETPPVYVQPQPNGRPVVVQQSPGTLTTIAGGVFDAFKTSPILLLIVLLNMAFAGIGGHYLLTVEEYRAKDRETLADLLKACLTDTVPIKYLDRQKASP